MKEEGCMSYIEKQDKVIFEAIQKEYDRQNSNIELIASENFVSEAVMEAQGSVLTNKYAEGYPGRRYYGGCEYVDVSETVAIDRAKALLALNMLMYNLTLVHKPTWLFI